MVFTDIDGTLTDIITGQYKQSKDLIQELKENNIPVVLCSAKTVSEQEKIRKDMRLRQPFIVENGGAVIIPVNYFSRSSLLLMKKYKKIGNYLVIEIGKPARIVRKRLDILRRNSKIEFKGVADLSIKELSRITSLRPSYARRMADRKFGETILQINQRDIPEFTRRARDIGLKVIHGGRFLDVTTGNDKGEAVKILLQLFRKEYGQGVMSFGIGDSLNDAPMLRHMDVAMLVQRPDKSWSHLQNKNIINLPGIGPKGWKNALDIILKTII
ncbi:MAG TPA: HAD-IIB family hydrolase [Candidatus Nitrosopolaris sp.]|nr:HAD-IIB family hydrolase [Candidatus Nitrosopolaris sp.]